MTSLTYQICCPNKDVCPNKVKGARPNKGACPNNSVCLNNSVCILLASYSTFGQQLQVAPGAVEAGVPKSNKCTGGDSCCTLDNPCDEGEGDCDSDEECSGNLFCSRSCGDQVQGGLASLGGNWDIGDDCCLDPIKNQNAATLNKVSPGNALARVQRVDLWDITFCTRGF